MIKQRPIQPPPPPPSCAGSKQTPAHSGSRTALCLVTVRHRPVMKWIVFWTGSTKMVGPRLLLQLSVTTYCIW